MERTSERIARTARDQCTPADCPCDAVRRLEKITADHERRLTETYTQLAVINTKINWLIAILGSIGAAIMGAVCKLIL